jgi:hypothetical protein
MLSGFALTEIWTVLRGKWHGIEQDEAKAPTREGKVEIRSITGR